MAHKQTIVIAVVALSALVAHSIAFDTPAPAEAHIRAATPERAGRYLVLLGGCNDCHTPGFAQGNGNVPESEWLTGVPVGFRGPWGTTYPSNLRLFIKPFTEDDFVKLARTRNSRPPMVWPSLHAMSDQDLRAIYRYLKSLGEAGIEMPQFVPSGQEPKTPYVDMMPQMPKAKVAAATTRPISAAQ